MIRDVVQGQHGGRGKQGMHTNESGEEASTILREHARASPGSGQNGGGQADGHVHVQVTNVSPLDEVPVGVA